MQDGTVDFYGEVAELLRAALAADPRRHDLRFKLIEIYAVSRRKAEFLDLVAVHREAVAQGPDPYAERILGLGRVLAPEQPAFRDPGAAPADAARIAPTVNAHRRFYEALDAQRLAAVQTEVHQAYQALRQDPAFWRRLLETCHRLAGPPPSLVHARRLSQFVRGPHIFVRNETARTPLARAAVNLVGQAMLAQAMGRTQLVTAGTLDGEASLMSRVAGELGLELTVLVTASQCSARSAEFDAAAGDHLTVETLPDDILGTAAQRVSLERVLSASESRFYVSPLDAGPYPWPLVVRELQSLHGRELRAQLAAMAGGRNASAVVVSSSDGMTAIGFLQGFLGQSGVELFCVESAVAGNGGQRVHREHAWLRATGRVGYSTVPPEVARFAANYCLPDGVEHLHAAGGEALAETFVQARRYGHDQVLLLVIPADPGGGKAP